MNTIQRNALMTAIAVLTYLWIPAHADTPLMGAAATGDLASVKALIASGADVNAKTDKGWTALLGAATEGRTDCVKVLIADGANVNARADHGWTALLGASTRGQTECVKALIASGADVNAETDTGWTALKAATGAHFPECVKLLVAAGARGDAPSVVNSPSPPAKLPLKAGEIELVGSVTRTDNSTRAMVIAAESLMMPEAAIVNFPKSRDKTIIVTAHTTIDTSDAAIKAFGDIPLGAPVAVIGKDGGVGQPLTARIVIFGASATNIQDTQDEAGVNGQAKNYTLVAKFTKRVSATLSTTVMSPETADGALYVYAPVPPNLLTQKLVSCNVTCPAFPRIKSKYVSDSRDPTHLLQCLIIPVSGNILRQPLEVNMNYVVDLYTVSLNGSISSSAVSLPTPNDLGLSLNESVVADFKNPVFQQWLSNNGLLKSPSESNFDFGRRAFKYLYERMTYGPPLPTDRVKASVLCNSMIGDCGAMSILFASTMRANKLPSRIEAGRWALSETPGYGQYHCTCQLYDDSIGWFPIDLTFASAEYAKRANPDRWYGHSDGELIVFNENEDPDTGLQFAQFMNMRYKGGSVYNPKFTDHWHVINTSK